MPETKEKPTPLIPEMTFKEKLKIYLFLITPPEIDIPPNIQLDGVLAYRIEEASQKIKPTKPTGFRITYTGNYLYVDKILERVGGLKTGQFPQIVLKTSKGIGDFKAGLLLMAEEYIKDEKDREDLKRIIEKIDEDSKKKNRGG